MSYSEHAFVVRRADWPTVEAFETRAQELGLDLNVVGAIDRSAPLPVEVEGEHSYLRLRHDHDALDVRFTLTDTAELDADEFAELAEEVESTVRWACQPGVDTDAFRLEPGSFVLELWEYRDETRAFLGFDVLSVFLGHFSRVFYTLSNPYAHFHNGFVDVMRAEARNTWPAVGGSAR